jgi:hypothetical protein
MAAILAACLPALAGANLIQNGGFEAPVVYPAWFDTYWSGVEPSGFMWSVGIASVDQIGSLWRGASNTEGDQSVDIDYDATLSQSFNTTPGMQYYVKFYYSHNYGWPSATGYVTVMGAGPTPLLSDTMVHSIPNTYDDMKFTLYTGNFTADSVSTTLTFQGDYNNGLYGFVVDAVEANPVPLPGALALAGSGLAGMIFWRRRG